MSEQQLDRTVLLVAYWFPPHARASSIRAAQLARILAGREWRVLVLHADMRRDDVQDAAWAEALEQVGIERYTAAPSRKSLPSLGRRSLSAVLLSRMLRQPFQTAPDYYSDWIESALHAAERIIRQQTVNLVLGVAPPLSAALAADAIARRWNIPFALDIGETIELIPHRAPSYAGRNQASSLEQLLRSALYASVPSRQEKEQLLRHYDFLTHEEIGILPYEDANHTAQTLPGQGRRLAVVLEEADPSLLRPLLKVLRSEPQYHLQIATDISPVFERILEKWQLTSRVSVNRILTPVSLDRWLTDSDTLIAYATRMQATPSAIVHRAVSLQRRVLAIGEHAALFTMANPTDSICVVRSNSASAIAAALGSMQPVPPSSVQTRDDVLEREFSRRLGMVMKL